MGHETSPFDFGYSNTITKAIGVVGAHNNALHKKIKQEEIT